MGVGMSKKYFTAAEANSWIPYLQADIERLREIKREYMKKAMTLKKMKESQQTGVAAESQFELEASMEFLQMEAKTVADSIRMKGAELKDVDTGLVDFPAMINGEEVLLCWRMGETQIEYFHSPHDGFQGRKRLPEDNSES
jgi:hypothetical protein